MARARSATLRLVCGLVAAVAVSSAWAQPGPVVVDAIVASVNGRVILASDVRAATVLVQEPAAPTRDPVETMIERTLMLEDVERASAAAPADDAVEARRRDLEARIGDAERTRLATRDGMTAARLQSWVRDDLRIESYIAQRFTAAAQPTDEEVVAYFAANAARFAQPGEEAGDAASERARAALVAERRHALIAAWLDGLRRRADIVMAPR